MSPIAIYYDNTIICWSSIVIVAGIIIGFLISNSLYSARNKYGFAAWMYLPLATALSLFLSRAIHWYCHMEQYTSFKSAITSFNQGDYCITGVLIATWFVAFIMSLAKLIPNRFNILDSFAPGLAFTIGIIRLSALYNTGCRGKILIENPIYQRLPLASGILEADGTTRYRLATFFISFILLMIITITLLVYAQLSAHNKYKAPMRQDGHIYGLFLLLFSAEEIIIDSTRYDASHLFFSGEKLANLNKGASFMGLSQFAGAMVVIYLFVYYLSLSVKAGNNKIKHISLTITFLAGFILAGTAEYLVQRYGSMYIAFYSMQSLGVLLVVIATFLTYRSNVLPKEK